MPDPSPSKPPFWQARPLEKLTRPEWESLCDGCGRCCLHKLRDDDTEELAFTNVACRLLHVETARCTDYENRKKWVPDCVRLTAAQVRRIDWLPPSCAYRLVAEGQDLPWWHPLVSGRAETVAEAGISVLGKVIPEREAGALEDHIVDWPGRIPKRARPRPAVKTGAATTGAATTGAATTGAATTPAVKTISAKTRSATKGPPEP